MKKIIIILGIVIASLAVKSQDVDTTIAFTIEKEIIDLKTGATYIDSLYVVALNLSFGFPTFGQKGDTQLIYNVYASKNLAWDGYDPIYRNSILHFTVGYSLSGYSVTTILTKIRNDMLTRFSGWDAGDVVSDVR